MTPASERAGATTDPPPADHVGPNTSLRTDETPDRRTTRIGAECAGATRADRRGRRQSNGQGVGTFSTACAPRASGRSREACPNAPVARRPTPGERGDHRSGEALLTGSHGFTPQPFRPSLEPSNQVTRRPGQHPIAGGAAWGFFTA
eukprot:12528191-Alexandrium_andersonii.AAC.1